MKAILFIVFLACIISANAQTVDGYKHAFKVYATGSILDYNNTHYINVFSNKIQNRVRDYVQPSFAITSRTKKGNYHEAELSRLDFSQTENSAIFTDPSTGVQAYRYLEKIRTIQIAVRYEYIIVLNKKKNAWLVPTIGFAAMPYFTRYSLLPYYTANYPMTTASIGVRSMIVPRVNVNLSKKILLDVNVPICIFDGGHNWQHIQNPTLPVRAQKYSVADFQALPGFYSARLGLGWKI